jgi:hypothetical protein
MAAFFCAERRMDRPAEDVASATEKIRRPFFIEPDPKQSI